jgi:hypothetical protein
MVIFGPLQVLLLFKSVTISFPGLTLLTFEQEMGGPSIPWRPGRIDGLAKDATPDGRLPDAAQGQDHLRAVSVIAFRFSQRIIMTFLYIDLLPYGV